ncbi:MAG: prepilin-type N-terminal cleavage/methylation domain-containing protein [Thiobacillus sp.]
MRTSVPGCSDFACRPITGRGFTLIELLVVLVIISVGLSVAVVALRPDSRAVVREEGERLALLLGLADEESGVNGMPLAWVGNEGSYEFQARELTDQGPDWSVIRGDDLLRPRQLPNGMTIRSVRVDGRLLGLGQRVALGRWATHELAVELALGEDRVSVTGRSGRFASELMKEGT